ncbi:single-stranded DNA-binding protein [Candidatus Saccharibacteria bacterium]|nr:single-stranded DNA-binding protein [Candidatus Saccharibacteria bacterium]
MKGFSKAIICGNITRDPELRTTANGNKVCTFSVAVNRTYKDASGNNQDSVSFIECSAWGKAAEIISQYMKKGSGILVSGRLNQRSWDDKETGKKRSAVEIVVEEFSFMGGDRDGSSSSNAGASQDVIPDDIPDDAGEVSLDDIPF